MNEVALVSLKELAVSLTCTTVACFFVATPTAAAVFLTLTVSSFAVALLMRMAALKFRELGPKFQFTARCLEVFAPLNTVMTDDATRGTLIHEGGHALSANLLYKNPRVKVSLNTGGGVTRYSTHSVTKLGKFLEPEKRRLMMAAAGPLAHVAVSIIALVAAHYLADSHPNASLYLNLSAIMGIFTEVAYAVDALLPTAMPNGDFVKIAACGIHPAFCIVAFIVIPLIIKAILLKPRLC